MGDGAVVVMGGGVRYTAHFWTLLASCCRWVWWSWSGPSSTAQGWTPASCPRAGSLQVSSAPGRLHSTSYLLLLQVDRVVTGQQGEEAGPARPRPRSCHGQAQTEVESDM